MMENKISYDDFVKYLQDKGGFQTGNCGGCNCPVGYKAEFVLYFDSSCDCGAPHHSPVVVDIFDFYKANEERIQSLSINK